MQDIEVKLKQCMAVKKVKSWSHLSNISGVPIHTINNLKDGKNVGIKSVAALFESMKYQLIAVPVE